MNTLYLGWPYPLVRGGFQDTYGQSVTISPSVMFGLKGVRRLTEIPELCTGQVAAQQAQPAVRSRDESL